MKRILFLSYIMVMGSGCSVLTDFSDDSSNNQNNVNNTNNTFPELCANGIDDDGDGDIDCWDKDCNDEPVCRCSDEQVFFNSEKTCDHDEMCLVSVNALGYYGDCASMERTLGGDMYDSCGPGGECPMGATCLSDGYYFNWECVPACSKLHDYCPDGRGPASLNGSRCPPQPPSLFALKPTPCNPTEPNSCEEMGQPGKACNAFVREDGSEGTTTRCMPHGDKVMGEACSAWADCIPGHVCVPTENDSAVCLRWCDRREDNACAGIGGENWVCFPMNTEPWGVCAPPDATAK